MFGLGTFHGDPPGQRHDGRQGNFLSLTLELFVTPEHVRNALFGFFYFLAKGELKNAFDAMLTMAAVRPTGKTLDTYYASMNELMKDLWAPR